MNTKLTAITAILATTLLLAGSNTSAFAATAPTSKILAIAPTNVLNIHTVIFQVCAGDQTSMRAPEVLVASTFETKSVKLNKAIAKDTCTTTATQLTAIDPNNIKIKVINKSKLNTMIDAAEKRLFNIKKSISDVNAELQELMTTLPGNSPTKVTDVQKVNQISSKLVDLRKELSDSRSEYYRLLYVLKGA